MAVGKTNAGGGGQKYNSHTTLTGDRYTTATINISTYKSACAVVHMDARSDPSGWYYRSYFIDVEKGTITVVGENNSYSWGTISISNGVVSIYNDWTTSVCLELFLLK